MIKIGRQSSRSRETCKDERVGTASLKRKELAIGTKLGYEW